MVCGLQGACMGAFGDSASMFWAALLQVRLYLQDSADVWRLCAVRPATRQLQGILARCCNSTLHEEWSYRLRHVVLYAGCQAHISISLAYASCGFWPGT